MRIQFLFLTPLLFTFSLGLSNCSSDDTSADPKEEETCDELDVDCDGTVDPVETGEPTIEIEEPAVEPEPSVTETEPSESLPSEPSVTDPTTTADSTTDISVTVATEDCAMTTWYWDVDGDGLAAQQSTGVTVTAVTPTSEKDCKNEFDDDHSKGYAYLLAYNKTTMRIYEGKKTVTCSGNQCTGSFSVTLNEDDVFGATTPFSRLNQAVVFLRGYDFKYDNEKEKNVKDHRE